MLKLKAKIEQVKSYIQDIIDVIKRYNPNTSIVDSHDLCNVATEIETILNNKTSANISYFNDIADSKYMISMQIPVVANNNDTNTYFYVKNDTRTTVTISGKGTTFYDNGIDTTLFVRNSVAETPTSNVEGWRPLNVTLRSNDKFERFSIKNSNIVALKCNLEGMIDIHNLFENNSKLRYAEIIDISARNMNALFKNCTSLTSIKLDLKENIVDSADELFYNCTDLMYVYIDLSRVYSANDMFYNCKSLERLEVPQNSLIPNNLDLSHTNLSKTEFIRFINSLRKNLNCTIYTNLQFSQAQLDGFKAVGFTIEYKNNNIRG